MFDVNHTLYTKDDEMGEVEPIELHDEDFEKVEEGVDVEIDKTAIRISGRVFLIKTKLESSQGWYEMIRIRL